MLFCIKICCKTALCKRGPGCGQLEQDPDHQGAVMEAGWATPMVSIMWIVLA